MCPDTPFLDMSQPAQADCLEKNSVDSSIFAPAESGHRSQLLSWFGAFNKAYVNIISNPVGSQGPGFPLPISVSKLLLSGHTAQ